MDDEATKERRYRGLGDVLLKTLSVAGCCFVFLYVSGAFFKAGVVFQRNQYNAIFVAVVLTLSFLIFPSSRKQSRNKLQWYDVLLLLASVIGCTYVIVNALQLAYYGALKATSLEMALGAITVLALLEAVRRTFGWAMVIISLVFLFYAKFGYLLPGSLHIYYYNWSTLTANIYLSYEGIFGSITTISSTIILPFLAFATFFVAAGGGEFFMNLALSLSGTMTGGPAKVAIIGSALFGTLSGSPSANIAVTGTVTIPLMKSVGFESHYAGAVEAVASCGGDIMPPVMGSLAFVMAAMLGKSYAYVATIAIIPAILYFVSLYAQVHFQACKKGLQGLPREQLPSLKSTIKEGWEFAIPILVLIWLLFVLKYPAQMAAVYTIVSVVVVSMFRRKHRLNLKRIVDSLDKAMRATLPIVTVMALAEIILTVLVVTGVGLRLSAALVTLTGGSKLFLVIISGLTCYILGMGVSYIVDFILVASLVAPALETLGVPIVATYFFLLYVLASTSFTPPYCTASFVAGSIAKANPYRVGFQAMRLGIVCFIVPFVIIYNQSLILIGTPLEIVRATTCAVIGIIAIAAGIEGYLFSRASWPQRVLFIIGGIAIFTPYVTAEISGAAALAGVIVWHWRDLRRAVASG